MTEGASDAAPGRAPLFAFAAIADTHVNPEDGSSSSPWQTNRLANARARAVVAQINVLNPAFVIHLGDIVHPVPAHPAYAAAAERFRALFAGLRPPLHLVPGNHDMGDKPAPWTPAASVNAGFLELYRQHFGRDFYAFDHEGCRFVIVNSQLLNSGLPDERVQWDWLENELATHRRAYLFKHYPPFLCDADEDEHYDNVAEPARARLLALLRRHPAEALFCGHVHNFFYDRIGSTDCYVLPATSAVRHDYMELFPVPPAGGEHGRDARSKLGFFWVEVFPDGHVAHWVRSWGETEEGRATRLRRPKVHVRGATAPVGVDLRHGWADPISIPYTGVVDEFGRKRVRNDYLVAALSELGLRRLRIPLQDLTAPDPSRRVEALSALGHRFMVFTFGLPDARQRARLARFAASLAGIEIVERASMLPEIARGAAALRLELGIPVFLSKLRVSAETEHDAGRFAHFIRHGFLANEPAASTFISHVGAEGIDGLVFRVERGEAPWPTLHAIAEVVRAQGLRGVVHVRLAGNDPAKEVADDADTARRVADTALAAWALGDRLCVCFDTFADHDRGYFPRHGLVDRACDPRPAGAVLRALVELFHETDWRTASVAADGATRIVRAAGLDIVVLLPESGRDERGMALSNVVALAERQAAGVRLDTGAAVGFTIRTVSDGHHIEWHEPSSGIPIAVVMQKEAAAASGRRRQSL